MDTYRIRSSNVHFANGYTHITKKGYLAEKKIRFLFWNFFFPVVNARWRTARYDALSDIHDDIALSEPNYSEEVECN